MRKINVQASTHQYPIYIGKGLRKFIHKYFPKDYYKVLIITDERVSKLYLQDLLDCLDHFKVSYAIVSSGEQSKSIEVYHELLTKALKEGLNRHSLILALGGGMVGDLAGFVAATFMRGIDYIQVPTTILAHDSSVGGKVAINHAKGKNLIGSFYAPKAVIYDVETLKTLPKDEVRSGYAEILKEALIGNKQLFYNLLTTNLEDLTFEQLNEQIYQAIHVKKTIVEKDERESYERMYLNLGHTLGHAVEMIYTSKGLLHGEAVAIGLLFSLFVSEKEFCATLPFKKVYQWLLKNNFPLQLDQLDLQKVIDIIKLDKKNTEDGLITLVLLRNIEHPVIKSFQETEIYQLLQEFFDFMYGDFNA